MDIRTPIATNGGDGLSRYGEAWKSQVEALKQKFKDQISAVRMPREHPTDIPTIYLKLDSLIDVLGFLKIEKGFEYDFLSDITATDEERDLRFEVVYHLFSTSHRWRIRVKVQVREGEEVPTAVSLWPAANWAEREVWDMFGVRFKGHPDLRRILMDYRWEGYPLRKDYPLRGYQIFSTPPEINPELLK